jgi:hypothetical protein
MGSKRKNEMIDSEKRAVCFQTSLDGLRICARDFAGIDGAEGLSGELAVGETAGIDFVEVLDWQERDTNG